MDDFLFGTITSHPVWGELFSRILLETIFQRKFGSLPYDDGARTLFLYTKGTEGNPPKELQELLYYMENSVKENAVNENLEQIHQIVTAVKQNREVEISYMKSWEWEQEIRKEASEAGRAEERRNTEREKQRADRAEAELKNLREELRKQKEHRVKY